MPNYFYMQNHDSSKPVTVRLYNGRNSGAPSIELWYKLGDNGTWTQMYFSSYTSQTSVTITGSDKLYWKAGSSGNSTFHTNSQDGYGWYFDTVADSSGVYNNDVDLGGDITTLLDENGSVTTLLANYALAEIFKVGYNESSAQRYSWIYDISDLEFPSATLTTRCYWRMFLLQKHLIAPKKPAATTLADYCFSYMYYGCSNITQGFSLDWATMATGCYYGLFGGTGLTSVVALNYNATLTDSCFGHLYESCSSLATVPSDYLPWTSVPSGAYNNMFAGTGLSSLPALPASNYATYYYMFANCLSLVSVPADYLSAGTGNYMYYYYMFEGCTNLEDAPDIYNAAGVSYMFQGCTKLKRVKVRVSNWFTYHVDWLKNVGSSGTFVCPEDFPQIIGSSSYIPSGWTVVTYPNPPRKVSVGYDGEEIYTKSNVSRQWTLTYGDSTTSHTGDGELDCDQKAANSDVGLGLYDTDGNSYSVTLKTNKKVLNDTIQVTFEEIT